MDTKTSFGTFFKNKRKDLGQSLREFCRLNGFDPGNISKIERGLLPPPQGEAARLKYAKALGIDRGGDEWLEFCDYAAAGSGMLPSDLAQDEEVLKHLPVLFRTIRDSKLSEEELERLIEIVRRESK